MDRCELRAIDRRDGSHVEWTLKSRVENIYVEYNNDTNSGNSDSLLGKASDFLSWRPSSSPGASEHGSENEKVFPSPVRISGYITEDSEGYKFPLMFRFAVKACDI
ncbi:jg17905 [Pararge aegeria aegeria]|uniref:Jg17905 protein n=1 Tax=Pararge aegeria aegeria TaxID=348720 RepID=A0A8S4SQ10_9NEOP|nr:jg17905 [Pararge aegeria aegeria]